MIELSIEKDIKYLKNIGIKVEKITSNEFTITNQQGVTLKVDSRAIKKYVNKLQNPKMCKNLINIAKEGG